MKRKSTVTPLTPTMFFSKLAAARNATIFNDYRSLRHAPQSPLRDHGRDLSLMVRAS